MHPHWNRSPSRNTLHHDSQYMMQCIASLENQLTKLSH